MSYDPNAWIPAEQVRGDRANAVQALLYFLIAALIIVSASVSYWSLRGHYELAAVHGDTAFVINTETGSVTATVVPVLENGHRVGNPFAAH